METHLLRIMQVYILSLMSMCAQSRVILFGQYVIVTREKLSWRNSGTFNRLRTSGCKTLTDKCIKINLPALIDPVHAN